MIFMMPMPPTMSEMLPTAPSSSVNISICASIRAISSFAVTMSSSRPGDRRRKYDRISATAVS